MKNIKYFIIFVFIFILGIPLVNANSLASIDINASIDETGTMHITENWQMTTNKDTEIYKEETNLGNMNIVNFKVNDEKRSYSFNSNWNINASFQEKKYKYGINYTNKGLELCWGISDYGNKSYTLSYDLTNSIFNTKDAQVLYLKLINSLDFPPSNFNITIKGYESFNDNLAVWGYGYEGYAYVANGKIYMSNKENTSLKKDEYVVLLVKFPLGTFKTDNSYNEYQTFNDVHKKAQKNTTNYSKILLTIITILANFIIVALAINKAYKSAKYKFGPAGRTINEKKVNMFRDIPCQKNIYRAFFISNVYMIGDKENFIGTILLKWLNEDKIKIYKTEEKKLFKEKEVVNLDLNITNQFQNAIEQDLYNILYKMSDKGILNQDKLKFNSNLCKEITSCLDNAIEYGCNLYVSDGLITKEKKKYLISDKVKEDAIKLVGLKKYLKEFSLIHTKQPLEVKLWKEYLMYAQIFGIASEVANQFKNLYPEILTEMQYFNYNINDIILLSHFNNTIVTNAKAMNYSAGGGGFSVGGGGGGSFGGGGGGSR